jgi:hypothetical protein
MELIRDIFASASQQDHHLWFHDVWKLQGFIQKYPDFQPDLFPNILQSAIEANINPKQGVPDTVGHVYILIHCILMSYGQSQYIHIIKQLRSTHTNSSMQDFLITPVLDEIDIKHYLAPAMALLADIINLPAPVIPTNSSSQVLIFNSLNYTASITPEQFTQYRQDIVSQLKIPHIAPPIYCNGRIGIFMGKFSVNGADYRAIQSFLKKLCQTYPTTLFVPQGQQLPTCVKDFVYLPANITPITLQKVITHNAVDVMLFTTHVEMWATVLCQSRIGRVQIALLANTHTSGLSEMDYYMLPEWDTSYYSEQRLSVPYMGCNMSSFDIEFTPLHRTSNQIMIYCPWSLMKITREAITMLLEVRKSIYEKHSKHAIFVFHIFNSSIYEKFQAKIAMLCDTVELEYIVTEGGLEEYYQLYEMCDLAIASYPFGGFTTIVDALYYNCPIYTIDNRSSYSGQSGARILETLGLNDYVCARDNIASRIANTVGNMTPLPSRAQIDTRLSEINDSTTQVMLDHVSSFITSN